MLVITDKAFLCDIDRERMLQNEKKDLSCVVMRHDGALDRGVSDKIVR